VCELDIADPENCGGCGVTCAANQVCGYGVCQTALNVGGGCSAFETLDGGNSCGSGTTYCPNDAGFCICPDTSNDPNNCGGCGIVCASGAVCNAGSCAPACPSGQVEDLSALTEGNSSGNTYCLSAAAAAASSVTVGPFTVTNTVCPSTGASAGAYLATLSLDPDNCGACGNVCPASQTCFGGKCASPCGYNPSSCILPNPLADGGMVCPTGSSACLSTTQCGCTDLQTDPQNCGSCGQVCGIGQNCQGGQCVSGCPSGQMCATAFGSGSVCASSCPSYYGVQMTACGTGAIALCTLTNADPNNCGSCGHACPAGQGCDNGTCAPSCNNVICGTSGYCAEGQTCVADAGCEAACSAGQICSELFDTCSSTCP
jgi:hypothetical protein